jgi:DNA-3-methyladenine glycosylase
MTEPIHDLLTADMLAETTVLPRGFYQRPTALVARELLGKILVRRAPDGVVAVRLTEIEAYLGIDDPACHTFGGRRTRRTETMWGAAGVAYIYLIYGIHHCLNVVTVGEGVPEAVLIRGGAEVTGGSVIRRRRGAGIARRNLLDGPGKLCQALALTRRENGLDFCDPQSVLTIRSDGQTFPDERVECSPRVGVDYSGEAAAWPLRLMVSSRPR